MTNNFIAEYNELTNIRNAYDSAETEVEKNGARGDFKAFKERIAAKGNDYAKYFWIFEDAWRRGNNYIDFSDVIRDEDVPNMITTLRTLGFRKFTFSSSWSSAVETAWLFTKNGCLLEGMVEINSKHKDFETDEYEKIHAYLFNLN